MTNRWHRGQIRMHFVPPNVELNDGYFLPWKEKAQKNCNIGGQISFL